MSDDLISKSKVIEHIAQQYTAHGETVPEWLHIGDLPSAQPKLDENTLSEQQESDKLGGKTGETCTDCISRQAAIDALACLDDYEEQAIEALRKLPSAQPEIIRCRDCKNWDKTWPNDWSPEYHYCPMIDGVRKGDFYCAHAERRTDERSD